jgi:hypothetical protein
MSLPAPLQQQRISEMSACKDNPSSSSSRPLLSPEDGDENDTDISSNELHYDSVPKSSDKSPKLRFICCLLTILILTLFFYPISQHIISRSSLPTSLSSDSPRGLRCSSSLTDYEIAAPFIFDSIFALAKQWPNTYAPNGHSIVPVTFPRNMPLYHANFHFGAVRGRTWFAFDA